MKTKEGGISSDLVQEGRVQNGRADEEGGEEDETNDGLRLLDLLARRRRFHGEGNDRVEERSDEVKASENLAKWSWGRRRRKEGRNEL